jgi:hypothetical protein
VSDPAPNPLKASGKPLFFRASSDRRLVLKVPAVRLGDALRTGVRSLSVMQKEALVASARTGIVWRLASDEGAYLAGLDEAPCPLAFFTVGMVSAYFAAIVELAKSRGIALERVRLVQDNYYTMVGSALRGTMTGGARNVDLTAQIASLAAHDELTALVADAALAAPLNGLLRGSKPGLFTLTHNGHEVAGGRVPRLARPATPDPNTDFDVAMPASGDWTGIVRREGLSPKLTHSVAAAGSSLADQQNRFLHIRGICEQREDGVLEVEQHLYNPHGSVFRFLCDELPVAGGGGRAPDAATYASAGIAFCFMTQLGRYAAIARKRLDRYRVVQDTHLSRGVAGPLVSPGDAAPVETHVYLDSGEDDVFASTALDMAEQTCFLHALCRTALGVNVVVQDYTAELPKPSAVIGP